MKCLVTLRRLSRDESGAAASEYAIVVAFVAAAIALVVAEFDLTEAFKALSDKIKALIP